MFPVAANAMASVALGRTCKLLASREGLRDDCVQLAAQLDIASRTFGKIYHPAHGIMFGYEVDGFGGSIFYDDANVVRCFATFLLLLLIADCSSFFFFFFFFFLFFLFFVCCRNHALEAIQLILCENDGALVADVRCADCCLFLCKICSGELHKVNSRGAKHQIQDLSAFQ